MAQDRQDEVMTELSIVEVLVMQCGLISTDINVENLTINNGCSTSATYYYSTEYSSSSHFQQIILHKFLELLYK